MSQGCHNYHEIRQNSSNFGENTKICVLSVAPLKQEAMSQLLAVFLT